MLIPAVAALMAIPATGAADDPAKLSCTRDVTYSKEFLAKFPQAPAACTGVAQMKGQRWALFDAEVKKVEGNHLTVTFTGKREQPVSMKMEGNHLTVTFPDEQEQPVATMTFAFDPDAQITTADDQPRLASKLEAGDKIKVWMPESRIGLYATPGASESQHFALVGSGSSQE
jgi:hypothetical protein